MLLRIRVPRPTSFVCPSCLGILPHKPPKDIRRIRGTLYSTRNHSNNPVLASDPTPEFPTSVAVLGGGITGLATVLFLRQYLKSTVRITLFESSNRLGGWLQSSKHNVNGESVIFEHGPRSLRPSTTVQGVAAAVAIALCGANEQVLPTSRHSAAALNRFIYYPDRLARLPNIQNGLAACLSDFGSPLLKGVFISLCAEILRPPRSPDLDDESISSFFSRRFSPKIAENIVSAGIHGIYAGDIEQLSIKSLFPTLWSLERKHGSVTSALFSNMLTQKHTFYPINSELLKALSFFAEPRGWGVEASVRKMLDLGKSASLYTFNGGIEELAKLLNKKIRTLGVEVRHGTRITELMPQGSGLNTSVRVTWAWGQGKSDTDYFSHVISALPAKALLSALSNQESANPVLSLSEARSLSIPTVTVMVVNLYYKNPSLVKKPGFGYLLPRSLDVAQNPEFALGVVFDSYATPEIDTSSGTKLTVMLGGHWWNGWSSFPSQAEGIQMARSLLLRQLGITEEPSLAIASLQRDCIPQYHLGHGKRARDLGEKLQNSFGKRLQAAGASWHGVSVNDCIKSGFHAALNLNHYFPRFATLMESADMASMATTQMSGDEYKKTFWPADQQRPPDQ